MEIKETPADNAKSDVTPNLFEMTEIPVVLTYAMTDPATVIKFHCALILAEAEKEARQKFFALPDADQKAGRYAYCREFMASTATAYPEGLPGLDDFQSPDPGDAIRSYFASQTPMKAKVLEDAVNRYSTLSQPVEFFR